MILDKEPVAHILAIAVDGNWLFFEAAADGQRNEFFPVLAGAVIVAAVGNAGGEVIGVAVGAHEMIGSGFGSGVGGIGAVGGGFVKLAKEN